MSMWSNISVPLGVQQSLDTIFSAVMIGGINTETYSANEVIRGKEKVRQYTLSKFTGMFQHNIFNNTYAIFYDIITRVGISTFTVNQLEAIIDNNRDIVLDTPFINKNDFIGGDKNIPNDDDIINAMINILKSEYVRLSSTFVTEEQFDSACRVYTEWYKETYMFYICNNMTMIMSNMGLEVKLPGRRRRKYQGRKDADEYYRENMNIIESLEEVNSVKVTSIDEEWYLAELEKSKRGNEKALLDTGIHEIDSVWGTLERGHMLGVLGKTKGGKTTFCRYMTMRAIRKKLSVLVVIMEGNKQEYMAGVEASLIADISFREAKAGKGKMYRMSSKDIKNNKYKPDSQRGIFLNSIKKDIAQSEDSGHIEIIEGTQYVENFNDVLKAQYKRYPFDVVVIDSLINIQSKTGRGKADRISEAYMSVKQTIEYGLPKPVLAICTAQIKQEIINELRRNPEADIPETAGGESAETIRTPDFTLGLFSSRDELKADIMNMYAVAQRHSEAFDNFSARAYMDCSYFLSESDIM